MRRFEIKTREYAKFRNQLHFAAQANLSEWHVLFEPYLKRQFLQSGENDAMSWHQTRFERDVGLVLASGTHTRVGAEETP